MTTAKNFAKDYAQQNESGRCYMMGRLLEERWFSELYNPTKSDLYRSQGISVARPEQIPAWLTDKKDVQTHIWMGGRGSGKSCTAATYVAIEMLKRPNLRVAVLGPDFKVAVKVAVEGVSGVKTLIEKFDKNLVEKWDRVNSELTLINGSKMFCYSSESPKSIEGPEFHLSWVDEVALLSYPEEVYRERLRPAVRLSGDKGEPIREIITGTPDATDLLVWLYEQAQKNPEHYSWTTMATMDNIDNLDRATVERQIEEAGDSDFARAKFHGELILESSGALLSEKDFQKIRISDTTDDRYKHQREFDETVLCIDASHSEDVKSDETGLIIMARKDRHAYVIGDASGQYTPLEWANKIIELLEDFPDISTLVVEDDKSLAIPLIEQVLEKNVNRIGRRIKIKRMHHKNKSKSARAEPVSALYQSQRILHQPNPRGIYSNLTGLEYQWKSWNPKRRGRGIKSPDRIDACVYGATYLLLRDHEPDSFFRASAMDW